MKKKLSNLLKVIFLIVMINLFYSGVSFSQENVLLDRAFKTKIELKKFELIKNLKDFADSSIFNIAIEKVEWFVNEFYDRRGDEDYIKDQMNTYLISDEAIAKFLFIAAETIDYNIKKMILDYYKLKHNINPDKIEKIDYKIDPLVELKKYLPTADDMINNIYGEMEKKNVNATQKIYLLKQFESISTKYSKTTFTATAFVAIGGIIISAGILPVAAASGTAISIAAWLGLAGESFFLYKKSEYKNALDTGIRNRRKEYRNALEKITSDILTAVMNQLPDTNTHIVPGKKDDNITVDQNNL